MQTFRSISGVVRIYTDGQTDMRTKQLDSTRQADRLYIIYTYFKGSLTFASECYKLRSKFNMRCLWYKNEVGLETGLRYKYVCILEYYFM